VTLPVPDASSSTARTAADERLRPRTGQVVLAALVVGLLMGLAFLGVRQAADTQARSDALAGTEAARTNIVYTMRESLALEVLSERYLAGEVTRRDVQIGRALLGQRLSVIGNDGRSAGDDTPQAYRDALFALDAQLQRIPAGLLPAGDRPALSATFDPALDEFGRQARHLVDLDNVTFRTESRDEAERLVALNIWESVLLVAALAGAIGLALWFFRDVRRYFRRVDAAITQEREGLEQARAAARRAALLERGQARVLERLATGAPLHEQLASVAELASQASDGLPFRLMVADRVVLSESAQDRAVGDVLVRTWRIGDGSVAAESGELQLFSAHEGDDVAAEVDEVARQCCELASLVLEHDRASALLEYQANHDSLTGLVNRALLLDRIGEAMRRRERSGEVVAVLFCDLDRFKHVNDTYGHDAGDDVLVEVAGRFRTAVRLHDTVARLGGDEFVVLATWMNDESEVDALVDRVRIAIEQPYRVSGRDVTIGVSIGVAIVDDFMHDGRSALRAADIAMYRGKTRPAPADL